MFYIINRNTQEKQLKGIITSSLPLNDSTGTFLEYELSHTDTFDKQLASSFFEYIQIRRRFGTDT